jgi:uncharacterized protein (DUF305 family)
MHVGLFPMRSLLTLVAAAAVSAPLAGLAQQTPAMSGMDHHGHHIHHGGGMSPAQGAQAVHAAHQHDIGPAGETYDLRFIDAMVLHHQGALLMSEFVFNIGSPGVGALAHQIWDDQAQEIKAMLQWRKAWYPEAPNYSVAYLPGGDPNSMTGLTPMTAAQIAAMQMIEGTPTKKTRVTWFLEGMLHHHGAALMMAHDALEKSTNPTIQRISQDIISGQGQEILQIRSWLQFDGLNKPEYYQYDSLFGR